MRRLTILVAAVALLYAGYWALGAWQVPRSFAAGLDTLRLAGWEVEAGDIRTRGFPSRFDTTLTDLRLVAPDGQVAYAVPMVQVLALSYQPNRFIVVPDSTQTLRLGGETLTIDSTSLRASGHVAAAPGLPLQSIIAEAHPMTVIAEAGWRVTVADTLVAMQRAAETEAGYDLYARLDTVDLSEALRLMVDPEGRLPGALAQVEVEGAVTLDRPLDNTSFADPAAPPLVQDIALRKLVATWGTLSVAGDGALTVDAAGVPTGEINLRVGPWREILPLLINAGVVPENMAGTLRLLAQGLAGNDAALDMPLRLENGLMFLGPIPLGAAPRLR